MSTVDGSCLCGAITFTTQLPIRFCVHCHCRFCRLAHGAAFVTWVGVAEEQFSLTAGNDLLTWYQSSIQSRRGFCSRCGSTLFYTSTLSPGEIHVARPYLRGNPGGEPEAHVFFDQRVEWCAFNDSLPRITSDASILARYDQIEPLGED